MKENKQSSMCGVSSYSLTVEVKSVDLILIIADNSQKIQIVFVLLL